MKAQNVALIFSLSCLSIVALFFALVPLSPDGITGQEKVAISQRISAIVGTYASTITVYAQNSGGSGPVVLDGVIIKDSEGEVQEVINAERIDDNNANTANDLPTVDVELTKLDIAVNADTMNTSEYYSVTLVTKLGGSFVSPVFYPGQEKITIRGGMGNYTTSTVFVYAEFDTREYTLVPSSHSHAPPIVVWESAIIKDVNGSVKEVIEATNIYAIDVNTPSAFSPVGSEGLGRLGIKTKPETLMPGESYTVTLVSELGGSYESLPFETVGVTPW